MPELRRGFLSGFGAYFLWGLFPLYWTLLDRSGAVEVLAHRIVWSMLTIAGLVVVRRRLPQLRRVWAEPARRWPLIAAAVLISGNWGTYIWAVNHGHVVETSLGYFINPLFTVMLGVVVLSERLRPAQWSALAIAGAAVAGLTVEYGRPPWVALALTATFGLYGLAKKQAGAGAIEGMAIESAVMAPVALAVIVALGVRGEATVAQHGAWYAALLVLTGPVTALPLLLFGAAATRVSLTTLGLLQYVAPVMQLACGVMVFHEPMPPMRWAGFALVWLALAVLSWDGLAQRRRSVALAAATSPA
ncbi:MAG TPA: EamA family transporter RarD [Kribbellaceae bacterium]|nr:EamA family transporter RarD [Kribbellaceae bacterium]